MKKAKYIDYGNTMLYDLKLVDPKNIENNKKPLNIINFKDKFGKYNKTVLSNIKVIKSLDLRHHLYKDVLIFNKLKKTNLIEKLLQAIALQLGNQVSYNELGKMLGVDNQTIERYIDILEKAYIIFSLPSLCRNLRNELKKSRKIYFYDTGIRNALIRNFNPLSLRQDTGVLWENFWFFIQLVLI